MKPVITGILIALLGAFFVVHGSKMTGPILVAVGLSCILFGVFG